MKPITIDYVFWPAPVHRYSFREHLKAAEAGGFTSLAVAPEAYRQAISSGLSAKDMVTMASDKGVALRHLDTLTDWAPIRVPLEIDAGLRSRFDVSADECFAISEALGRLLERFNERTPVSWLILGIFRRAIPISRY
jgi:hypothetical protein